MCGCSGGACVVVPGVGCAWLLWGVCMVAPGGHAWLFPGGHVWLLPGEGGVVAPGGRHAWLLRGGACMVFQ